MTDQLWVIEWPGGQQEIVRDRPRRKLIGAYERAQRADREPCADGTEDWDFSKRRWAVNQERALRWVNRKHRADNGQMAPDIARAIKLVEARQTLGLPMTIAIEAQLLGIPVEELAQRVVKEAEAGITAEHDRIVARRGIRAA